jgi:hypothetical protein
MTPDETRATNALAQLKDALAAWNPMRKRYRIGDREMEFNSTADILALIRYWEGELQRATRAARAAAGLPTGGRFYVVPR